MLYAVYRPFVVYHIVKNMNEYINVEFQYNI